MKHSSTLFSYALCLLFLPIGNLAASGVEFNRAEEGKIYFDVPAGEDAASFIPAGIHEAEFIGKLSPLEGGIPYFLIAGKPCADCLRDRSIYIVRPTSTHSPAGRPVVLTYPGKILDSKTRALFSESQAFFGQCVKGKKESVLIIFQRERVDRRHHLQASVFIAEPGKDHLTETLLERRMPKLNETLQLVKKKSCQQIAGRNRAMLRKAFDIPTRFKRDEEEEDEDEDNEARPQPNESQEAGKT